VYNFLTKWNTFVWLNASLEHDDDIQRQVKSLYCSKQIQRHTCSVLSHSKKHFIWCVSHACQCMLANCGANAHRLVWSAHAFHVTMPTESCIAYPELQMFAHTKLTIVSGPQMHCWETTYISFYNAAHLYLTFYITSTMWWYLQIFNFRHVFNAPV